MGQTNNPMYEDRIKKYLVQQGEWLKNVVYNLKAESTVLTDDVDVKCGRSRGRVDESKVWTLLSIC